MEERDLVELANNAKENAYAPYSGFRVGAALISANGKVFTGCNIENASFGATVCAERTAVFKAVSEGENKIDAIAIISDSKEIVFPCGICRQVLAEFGSGNMKVICAGVDQNYKVYCLNELLPNAFDNLTK